MQTIKIKEVNGGHVFVTSDPHFNHANIVRFARTQFEDVEESDRTIIEHWNEIVTSEDTVFILGDVFWKKYQNMDCHKILGLLQAKKIYIVPGNHDFFGSAPSRTELEKDPRVEVCDSVVLLRLKDLNGIYSEIYLSHFPLATWPRKESSYNLHGHLHTTMDGTNNEGYVELKNQKDVGVDSNDMYPYEIHDALSLIDYRTE